MGILNRKKEFYKEQFRFINLKEDFYKYDFRPKYFDLSKKFAVKKLLNSLPKKSIAYLGSGDFHYISYFLIGDLPIKPLLILFDNHFDMNEAWEGILTCGSWVRSCIEEDLIRGVLIVGANKEYIDTGDVLYSFVDYIEDGNKILDLDTIRKIKGMPVYVSVDKDVLKEEIVKTSWDQGNMELDSLINWLKFINVYGKVLGVDICGEPEYNPIMDLVNPQINIANKKVNKKICNIFLN